MYKDFAYKDILPTLFVTVLGSSTMGLSSSLTGAIGAAILATHHASYHPAEMGRAGGIGGLAVPLLTIPLARGIFGKAVYRSEYLTYHLGAVLTLNVFNVAAGYGLLKATGNDMKMNLEKTIYSGLTGVVFATAITIVFITLIVGALKLAEPCLNRPDERLGEKRRLKKEQQQLGSEDYGAMDQDDDEEQQDSESDAEEKEGQQFEQPDADSAAGSGPSRFQSA